MESKIGKGDRHTVFMQLTLENALFNKYQTHGDFWDAFAARMKQEKGECTEEDLQWCKEHLVWFLNRNAVEPEKVDRRRRGNRGDGNGNKGE